MQEKKKIKNLEGTELKTVMLNGKIKFERLRNTLDEFQMNELKAKVNRDKNNRSDRKTSNK